MMALTLDVMFRGAPCPMEQVGDQLREDAAGRVRGATRSHRGDERSGTSRSHFLSFST